MLQEKVFKFYRRRKNSVSNQTNPQDRIFNFYNRRKTIAANQSDLQEQVINCGGRRNDMGDEQKSSCSETKSEKRHSPRSVTAHSPPSLAYEESGWIGELSDSSVQECSTGRMKNQTTSIMTAATEEESSGSVSRPESSLKKEGTMSANMKRKLLWRKSDRDQGVRKISTARCDKQDNDCDALSDKAQRALYQDLEKQFAVTLKRGIGQTSGLGL